MNEYSSIAAYYDALNEGCPYGEYADMLSSVFEEYGIAGEKKLVDYGCGTGVLTALLAQRGYAVTAFDISSSELSVAENRTRSLGLSVSYLLADMRRFNGAQSYGLGVCSMDCANYLLKDLELCDFFSGIYNSLCKGGVFVFDVNTLYRYERVYADNAYALESDEAFLSWQNAYDAKRKRCRFYLSLFALEKDGRYRRSDEVHTQKYHSVKKLKRLAEGAGLEVVAVYGDTDRSPLREDSEKAYFVLRKPL